MTTIIIRITVYMLLAIFSLISLYMLMELVDWWLSR